MNNITLIGNIGRIDDPKSVGSNDRVLLSFSVADDNPFAKSWTDKDGKEHEPEANWWNCKWFVNDGSPVIDLLEKGRKVAIIGRMEQNVKREDGKIVDRYYSLMVNRLELLGNKQDAEPNGNGQSTKSEPQAETVTDNGNGSAGGDDYDLDDLPF